MYRVTKSSSTYPLSYLLSSSLYLLFSQCLRIINIRTNDFFENQFAERRVIDIGFARKHDIYHVTTFECAQLLTSKMLVF